MGWRSVARSWEASARRAQRENERQARKDEQLRDAQESVSAFEDYLTKITSFHRQTSVENVDWESISKVKEPEKPSNSKARELRLSSYLQKCGSSKFLKKLRLNNLTNAALKRLIIWAQRKDLEEYNALLTQHAKDHELWAKNKNLAKKVLILEPKACMSAIESYIDFTTVNGLGSSLRMLYDGKTFDITIDVHSEDIIPKIICSLTPTGKLTRKLMPQSRFNEIYQDYVCSCMFRVAGDVLRLLPIGQCVISANDQILNPKNGHVEEKTICSALIDADTFNSINWDGVDASEGITNFTHNMKFKKASGFEPVDKVKAPSKRR